MVCCLLLAGALILVRPAAAQQSDALPAPATSGAIMPNPGSLSAPAPDANEAGTTLPSSIRYHQQKLMAEKGEKQLKKDTDQLLQLAEQLKQSVDKTNRNVLSIEVIQKTKEIEKLAKQIRETMQNGH